MHISSVEFSPQYTVRGRWRRPFTTGWCAAVLSCSQRSES